MPVHFMGSFYRAALAFAFVVALCAAGRAAGDEDESRFAAWESSLEGLHGTSGNFTVRNIGRASIAGSRIRVRISNPYGTQSITVQKSSIGLQAKPGQPALVPGSLRRLTFHHGQESVTIKPGEFVYSDAAHLRVEAQQNMAVSLYAPGAQVNDHTFPAPETNPPGCFISTAGDHTADAAGAAFPSTYVFANDRTPGWHPGELLWLDLIDVQTDVRGTIVALGDSITDGYQVNLGGDGAALPSPASQVIAGMTEIVNRVHARGLRIVGATVLPMCNLAGSDKEKNRLAVNHFIRTSGIFDGVIDWDAVMKDTADPTV